MTRSASIQWGFLYNREKCNWYRKKWRLVAVEAMKLIHRTQSLTPQEQVIGSEQLESTEKIYITTGRNPS